MGLENCIEREVLIAGLIGDALVVLKGAVCKWSHEGDTTEG